MLPALRSRQIELLDLPRLRNQLQSLERQTSRTGKNSVNHPPGGHDDVINAAAGALVMAASADRKVVHWYAASDNWDQYRADADAGMTEMDKMRRRVMGANWRAQTKSY